MRIAVVTSSPPFVEGGHLVIARELVRACRDLGHAAELVVTPQNRFGRQGAAYLAAWLTDVGLAADGGAVDQVISLRYPAFAVRHPRHTVLAQPHDARVPTIAGRRSRRRSRGGTGSRSRRAVR